MTAAVAKMRRTIAANDDHEELSQLPAALSPFTSPFEFLPGDTNNSMALADKPYHPPEVPEEIDACLNDMGTGARLYRETFRPVRRNYVCMYCRVRRRCYEQLLWQLFTSGVMKKEEIYSPASLRIWTVGFRIRLRDNYPMGRVSEAIKCRLGITNPGIRFCLDGFFGMVNYGNIFGYTTDACPWMEISSFSTVKSLRLRDGDNIFVSIASTEQIENVMNWRKKHAAELPIAKTPKKHVVLMEESEAGHRVSE